MAKGKRKSYELKHPYVADLGIPKKLYPLADTAIDHIGDIIDKIKPTEMVGAFLGLHAAIRSKEKLEVYPKYVATGILAAKCLESDSEIVGTVGIATLLYFGAFFLGYHRFFNIDDLIDEEVQKGTPRDCAELWVKAAFTPWDLTSEELERLDECRAYGR